MPASLTPSKVMSEKRKTFCRICNAFCALDVQIHDGRVQSVRGDRDDPETRGYMCSKGLRNKEILTDPKRLRRPLKRGADGALTPIALDLALDDIGERCSAILAAHGPRSIAVFMGTQCWFGALNHPAVTEFMNALGSPSIYGTMTIDQSAKWIANQRIGVMNSGRQGFNDSDAWMVIGSNPLVSMQGGAPTNGFGNINPTKTLKDAKARGMKLVVIDPRLTETARQADLFLQVRPGEDAALVASIVHIVLREGWIDQPFCNHYVNGIEALRAAVTPFTPEAVARRADVPAEQIVLAAQMFARDGTRGLVSTGTGTDMGPHSNVAEHLAQCLNVLCGRYLREGEVVPNPGVLGTPQRWYADVTGPNRTWDNGPQSRRRGLGLIYGQMMSAELVDEILSPGEGQVRALLCIGSNPAVCLPDQTRVIEALRSLDLLVTLDPRLSGTAKIADYVIAPTLALERHDHTGRLESQFQQPYSHYAPPVVAPPSDAELIDDWQFFWELAKRMHLPMQMGGLSSGTGPTPSTEDMLAATAQGSRVPLAVVRSSEGGAVYDVGRIVVEPRRPGFDDRLELAPQDVLGEIDAVAVTVAGHVDTLMKLIVRRLRDVCNSTLTDSEASRVRLPRNPAYLHPDELDRLGLSEGEEIVIESQAGHIMAAVAADTTLRRGIVSMAHCWGEGSDDPERIPEATSRLVSSQTQLQDINGMPIMTSIPVVIRKVSARSVWQAA